MTDKCYHWKPPTLWEYVVYRNSVNIRTTLLFVSRQVYGNKIKVVRLVRLHVDVNVLIIISKGNIIYEWNKIRKFHLLNITELRYSHVYVVYIFIKYFAWVDQTCRPSVFAVKAHFSGHVTNTAHLGCHIINIEDFWSHMTNIVRTFWVTRLAKLPWHASYLLGRYLQRLSSIHPAWLKTRSC